MTQSVFFAPEGAKGLNETSATKLAAVASNLKTKEEAIVNNPYFLNETCAIVGSQERLTTHSGMTAETLASYKQKCYHIGTLNGFISWLSEARKAVEAERLRVSRISMAEWAKIVGVTIPTAPEYHSESKPLQLSDIIAEMNIKERAEYLALEAKAAQLGKLIHPDGALDDARNEMHERIAKPERPEGRGRDMLVYTYTPSVFSDDVDSMYEELQRQYQNYESSLNHIKSDLRKKLDQRNTEINAKIRLEMEAYKKEREAYNQTIRELTVEFNQWLQDQVSAAAKIKIAIPECYEELLKELYNVGK